MKKLEFDIITLMDLKMELLDRYGVKVKARNYVYAEKPDPIFILDQKPSMEVVEFIWDYFDKMDGLVIFADDKMSFIVLG